MQLQRKVICRHSMCFHLQRDSLALPRSESCKLAKRYNTCNYYGDISPQSSDVYGANASWHSLPISLYLSVLDKLASVLLLLVILLFLCKSLHMAKLLSTIYQSYRPWLQINNGILIAYRKRKERERDGVCSIRFSVCCTCRLPQASGGWGNLLKLVRDCPCLLNVSCLVLSSASACVSCSHVLFICPFAWAKETLLPLK